MRRKVKKKRERKIVYYAIYVGKHKHITYAGIGRIIPGKEYLIDDKKLAESLATSNNWNVRKSFVYTDIG